MAQQIIIKGEPEIPGRLDVYLARQSGLTRSRIAGLMETGHITLEGQPVKAKDKVCAGGEYRIDLPDVQTIDLCPEEIPLQIVYEDEDIAVINKPRGMVVHPCAGTKRGTMVNALLARLDHLSGINGELRPGIVHRLDKDTTGAIVVAKNDVAHQSLSKQIQQRRMKRRYLAILKNCPEEEEGRIETMLGRDPRDRKRMAVVADGRRAVTHYRVVEKLDQGAALVECVLDTGRTHQIRVHMAYLGCPVLGDPVYGPKRERAQAKGQMLHAYRLGLYHPKTEEWMEFEAQPPEDFAKTLEKLRKKRKNP